VGHDLPDKHLLLITKSVNGPTKASNEYSRLSNTFELIPWYTDIVNYLAASVFPLLATKTQRDKLKSDSKYYVWDTYGVSTVIGSYADAFLTRRSHLC